jgi:hypothetical protein
MTGFGSAGTDYFPAGEFPFFSGEIFFDYYGITRMFHERIEYQYFLH